MARERIADELKNYYRACTTRELPTQLLALSKKLDQELLMSQVLEWQQRLESAHHQLHEVMTELITNKNYSEAERRLHYIDQLMVDLIEEMGGTAVRSGLWT